MTPFRVTCDDGYVFYIATYGLTDLSIRAVLDEDGEEHEVKYGVECSESELRRAWRAMRRAECES